MSSSTTEVAAPAVPTDPAARRRRILKLALPICGGMVSQNVLNLVDTGMVASLGDTSLAAVGLGGFLNFLLTAFILGLSSGVQAIAARRVGEGRTDEVAFPLNGGIVLATVLGIPISAGLVFAAPWIFSVVADDPQVAAEGAPYLQARLVAMTAMGINFAFRGHWNAVDKSMLYMGTLVAMHATNITLNWVLIGGNLGAPALGATGAGIASAASTYVGTLCYFGLGFVHARGHGFLRSLPTRETLKTMIRVSAPISIQQIFFAAGMTLFLTLVGRVGTSEVAASKVILDLMLVALLPGLGFGLAAASLVGQALGRGDPDDAERWVWEVAKLATVVVGVIALPAALAPSLVLGVFLHDPDTLAMAITPMRMVAFLVVVDVAGMVGMNALVGAGATRVVMRASIVLQWGLLLPVVWLIGPVLGFGLTAIWIAQVVYRLVQTATFVFEVKRGAWRTQRV
ncbi:MAG: MATE family efflux transporter [Sandaracinus sp.]|nr:MATE family efflux transporter [Myxococcales bacterium]MCB9603426.1 MATE family efflux transporter [Sandaracinus sp.]MCB9612209.1 MATE family efflux transporter [Sandaracinus sp.]MCB9618367.1 MATE family efflux transporter [Sandaracinus sp.]MCB9623053.1 MATE family efflux transporter [Sandaracinus sp.]